LLSEHDHYYEDTPVSVNSRRLWGSAARGRAPLDFSGRVFQGFLRIPTHNKAFKHSISQSFLIRMTEDKKEEKKGIDIADWVKLIGYVAAILVASTSLLSASGSIPSLWFDFSFTFLIGLILSVPVMIFAKPISKKIKGVRFERKRDAIAQKHFLEFENLVETARRFNSPIRDTLNNLKNHYANEVKSSLARFTLESYPDSEITSAFSIIQKELKESRKTLRDLSLIMRQFELVLETYKKYLKITEEFVHEMMSLTGKPIAKGFETEFESFREKYNYFVKDFKQYCQKVNQEIGEIELPEWAVDHIKKW